MAGAPVGRVTELWRYPVKSMRGERMSFADVDVRGLVGDRQYAVYDSDGKIGSGKITRRFRPIAGLREHAARFADDMVLVEMPDGNVLPVTDVGVDVALSNSLGQPVRLVRETDIPHFDAGAVHLLSSASLSWIGAKVGETLGAFAFRPNVIFETDVSWPAEAQWCGRILTIGDEVIVHVGEPTERCVMVGRKDDATENPDILRTLALQSESCLGIYAEVVRTGTIRCGDPLMLLD